MSKNREVKAIALKGLNKRDTINSVEDGWCEEMHNVAFRNGKIESVCQYQSGKKIQLGDYKIIYVHPVLPKSDYIVKCGNELSHIRVIDSIIIRSSVIKTFDHTVNMESVSVSHFENTLFLHFEMGGVDHLESFSYENEKYTPTGTESLGEFLNVDISYDYYVPAKDTASDHAARVATVTTALDGSGNRYVASVEKKYETIYTDIKQSNYLHGAIFLIFAYRMKDGTIIRNGKIHMLDAERGRNGVVNSLYKVNMNDNQVRFYKDIYGFKAKLSFFNSNEIRDFQAIKSIIVYSSRNNPIYDFENLYNNFPQSAKDYETIDYRTFRASSKCVFDKRNYNIASAPFYEIAEVDFRSTYSITLSASEYENIETKPIFTPIVSPHNYIAAGSVGLNRRLHQYNITAQLYKSAQQVFSLSAMTVEGAKYHNRTPMSSSELTKLGVAVTLNIGGERAIVTTNLPGKVFKKVYSESDDTTVYEPEPYLIIPNIISYPDARATKIDLFFSRLRNGVTTTHLLRSYDLQPAPANNYSTYSKMTGDAMMIYEILPLNTFTANNYIPIENKSSCMMPNQLMVSEIGNPHVFLPQHVYYVGDNDTTRIESVNTPTDQLTESRFGQYPLYLFTTTGIYAMEQGTNTILYQNIVKVNNDIIQANSNSMSAAGALYYFSSAGLMRLNGHTSKIASDAMGSSILPYIHGAVISLLPTYGELLISNNAFNHAYLYSLTSGVWSSRDFAGEIISHNNYIEDNKLYDLQREEPTKPLIGRIVTRELSLGSRQIKRLERLKANIITENDFALTLFGSLDGKKWCELTNSENCDLLKRSNSSWLWFKVRINGTAFVLDSLIFESFVRFMRHIR